MSAPLEGRVALVTGTTSGIGLALARGLGEAGATIILNSHVAGELSRGRFTVALGVSSLGQGLRTALAHDGPFSTRYPRDKAPDEPRPATEISPVPYGTWEQLRESKGDVAILAPKKHELESGEAVWIACAIASGFL